MYGTLTARCGLLLALSHLLPAGVSWGFAQGTPGTSEAASADALHANLPVAQAVRLTGPIHLDGRLDEPAWSGGPPITSFTQLDPNEGQPVSEPTEVRILYDAGAIYVGARLRDSGPVSTRLGRRDASFDDADLFSVAFDSYHDHLTAFRFAVNPSGVKLDDVISGGGGGPGGRGGDATWDPVWDVATAVTDSGWVVEMRIPFSQLRFSPAEEQLWGIQIERRIGRKQEAAFFSFTPKNQRGGVARYGHLSGLRELRAQNRLELLPYASARADYRLVPLSDEVDFGNPYRSGADYTGDLGADLKYRVTSNFTLDATFNPDFGQVEVDPAVVNLSAFETRFQERRPFFIEGANIFSFGGGGMMGGGGGNQLLYSRRIGRSPQVGVPGRAVYSEVPEATTILGAAKLTGRTSGGWSLGILEAVTARETGAFIDADGLRGEAVVEPLTNYFVGRIRRDLNGGRTRLGAITTAVNRSLSDPVLEDRLRNAAHAGGLDLSHEWADRSWSLIANVSPSYISGSSPVMVAAQRSSARYYHRPDATHLEVDSSATYMAGYAASMNVGKRSGAFTGDIGFNAVSPGYEINDLGFQTTADRISVDAEVAYESTRPGRIFREWEVEVGPALTFNYGGNLVRRGMDLSAGFELLNFWGGDLRISREGGTLNDRLTRGGPLTRSPVSYSMSGELETDPRQSYRFSAGFDTEWDEVGGWSRGIELALGWRPAENWEIEFGPEIGWEHRAAQYVTAVNDSSAASTFGRRYVFADLSQIELGLSTRLNVTFTPTLTLQLFAQPLLASGDYGALKELRAPRTFDFIHYGVDAGTISEADGQFTIDPDGAGAARAFRVPNRDFNVHELRGNAVLRWEWRPGSTLFLVWQQSRSHEIDAFGPDAHRAGRFDAGRDTRELFGLRPQNVLMIKATYWFNP